MTLTSEQLDPPPLPPSRTRNRKGGPDNLIAELGDALRFAVRTIVELPLALRYPSEVLRQAAIVILSSSLVVWTMLIVSGVVVGQTGHYLLTQIGASSYIGLFAAAGTAKAICPIFFGYIIAAKNGCGIVAELGSMRINEEIDAMEVMGIPARQYLVGTRVLGFIIAAPFLWMIGLGLAFVSIYVTNVHIFATASEGGYLDVFWAFLTPGDLLVRSPIWALIPAILAVIVSCYYGFTASGGPVGVGENTAKSMAVNVVLVSVVGCAIMFQLMYGTSVIVPIAN